MAQFKFPGGLLLKNKFVKYGLPFFILMVGGSFGLREFTNLRDNVKSFLFMVYFGSNPVVPGQLKELITPDFGKRNFTHSPYNISNFFSNRMIDIDSWENKRGPRPWEEGTQKI